MVEWGVVICGMVRFGMEMFQLFIPQSYTFQVRFGLVRCGGLRFCIVGCGNARSG